MKRGLYGLMLACAVVAVPQVSYADRDEHREGRGWHRGEFRHFDEHELVMWRGGHWIHGHHEGRRGWWWVVGGIWYFYAAPVYPYPDPYVPPVVVVPQAPQQAPVVVAPQAPPPAPQASPSQPAQTQYWYYCDASKNYYPYVTTCATGWKPVPVMPPGVLR